MEVQQQQNSLLLYDVLTSCWWWHGDDDDDVEVLWLDAGRYVIYSCIFLSPTHFSRLWLTVHYRASEENGIAGVVWPQACIVLCNSVIRKCKMSRLWRFLTFSTTTFIFHIIISIQRVKIWTRNTMKTIDNETSESINHIGPINGYVAQFKIFCT